MQNSLYTYPQSSCDCYNCADDFYEDPRNGPPNNLGVNKCYSKYLECNDRIHFKQGIEPKPLKPNSKHYINLNAKEKDNHYEGDFVRISCPDSKDCKISYASSDPRLISVSHGGQVLKLDRPPITSQIKLENIYNKSLNEYGKSTYDGYRDINAGQIKYYVDRTQEDAFFKPNFSKSAQMLGTLYKDPMGAMKPQYDRYPLVYPNHINTKNTNYTGSLSWIQDTDEHRQDLLSKQMRKKNQERWVTRWNKDL